MYAEGTSAAFLSSFLWQRASGGMHGAAAVSGTCMPAFQGDVGARIAQTCVPKPQRTRRVSVES